MMVRLCRGWTTLFWGEKNNGCESIRFWELAWSQTQRSYSVI
jgi:hypothetical protein